MGIETSCDETAAAVVENGTNLLSNTVASSLAEHAKYGGVVPEIAARSHIQSIMPVIAQALTDASCTWDDIDAIAVTQGPGLGGSLLIGVMTARSLALTKAKPHYAVNHVEAHVYANFLVARPAFPLLAVIVSGGHSQLVLFQNHADYTVLGQTHDDAIGEAFDKVAKMLGLPYPGGPAISQLALNGNPAAIKLPKAKMDKYDFSFSGLKTAVLRQAQALIGESYDFPSTKLPERLSEAQKADIAASFQHTAVETVVDKARLAYDEYAPQSVVLAGGVAANQELRRQLIAAIPLPLSFPPPELCTDNGAMIAALAYFKIQAGQSPADPYTLTPNPNLSM